MCGFLRLFTRDSLERRAVMDTINRREFIAGTVIATAAATMVTAADATMKLSLSTRNVEGERNATEIKTSKSFEEFLPIAKRPGPTPSAFGHRWRPAASAGSVVQVSRLTKAAGLKVSMVTPDFPVPINNDRAPECLRYHHAVSERWQSFSTATRSNRHEEGRGHQLGAAGG